MAKEKSIKALVIVESPAKAKKIGEYLGKDYIVRASMGHIRDLPGSASEVPAALKKLPWSNLGVNVDQSFEPLYIVQSEKKKLIKELKDDLEKVRELVIATDEDREGESIGWHLIQVLEPKVPVKRMVFSEITKKAIIDAINNPRDLNVNLVEAQETRRIVDRLYGYTLSPLLWKKIAPKLSAGRVQSVAVRVLVRRERERGLFKSGTYWDLKALLKKDAGQGFTAELSTLDGRKLASGKDFDETTGKLKAGSEVLLMGEAEAKSLLEEVKKGGWSVSAIEYRKQSRKPSAPFMTSTLQQEANRKLGMTARQAMQVAQRLYEDGYITYMRTDSVSLSTEALTATRGRIGELYGKDYLSNSVRTYANKTKNAQEAHEAIRPAGTEMRTAEELGLGGQEARLYAMIWKRTMASQMSDAELTYQNVTIKAGRAEFRASGKHIDFHGFFRAYVEGVDDPEAALDDQEDNLPPLVEKENLKCDKIEPVSHETKPPARYTEATLVRGLEDEGIGRPSTYASIISTIQDRGYVRKESNQLIPTFMAMAVVRLLEDNFPQLVDLGFTAGMEQSLDDISNGQSQRLPYLEGFYSGQTGLSEVVKQKEAGIDPREACTLRLAGVATPIRIGRRGPFLQVEKNGDTISASLPDSLAPADMSEELARELIERSSQGPRLLGEHPEDKLPILVKVGPFGPYLQVGEVTEERPKPRRVSIPKNIAPEEISLETALKLMELPRTLGKHPEDQKVVKAGIGPFGPYVLHNGKYKSLGKEQNVLSIELDEAVESLKQVKPRGGNALREVGAHPVDGKPVSILEGRYGPYLKHGKINATLPKETDINNVTMAEAVKLLDERAMKGGGKSKGRAGFKKAAKKAASAETAVKKTPAKKAPAKKAPSKKIKKKG